MLISSTGKVIRLRVNEIPVNQRVAQGVKLIELGGDENLVGLARTTSESDDESNGDDDPDTPDTEQQETQEE
jgi:DNA gyrase subunit A